ncbi:MAG: hypothetical protein KTR32_33420 [Granulosicoccus sp.]|nr:hypothetical protein [Granulosicoccus sp.]
MSEISQTQATMMVANGPSASGAKRGSSWFEAMADAWGQALDNQADTIVEMADELVDGLDSPKQISLLTAESLRMQFLSNSSHTAITAVGSSLETMARKQ